MIPSWRLAELWRRIDRGAVAVTAATGVLLLGCCGFVAWGSKPERVSRFEPAPDCVIEVWAEPSFHYEPPGYVSVEVRDGGRTAVPRTKFLPVGPERVPRAFTAFASADGRVVGLRQGNAVRFLLDRPSGRYWPPAGWSSPAPAAGLAAGLLAPFWVKNPRWRCHDPSTGDPLPVAGPNAAAGGGEPGAAPIAAGGGGP